MKTRSPMLGLVTAVGIATALSGCSTTRPATSKHPASSDPAVTSPASTGAASPVAAPNASAGAADARPSVSFGQATERGDAPTVTAEALLADPAAYDGRYLRVAGTVSKVCSKKGCWLALGGAERDSLMVRFTCPIDGRLIPMEAVGKDAVVEGTVRVVEESEAEARHLKEDAGASPAEIAKIVGPQKRVTIAAPAAKVFGLSAS